MVEIDADLVYKANKDPSPIEFKGRFHLQNDKCLECNLKICFGHFWKMARYSKSVIKQTVFV